MRSNLTDTSYKPRINDEQSTECRYLFTRHDKNKRGSYQDR